MKILSLMFKGIAVLGIVLTGLSIMGFQVGFIRTDPMAYLTAIFGSLMIYGLADVLGEIEGIWQEEKGRAPKA